MSERFKQYCSLDQAIRETQERLFGKRFDTAHLSKIQLREHDSAKIVKFMNYPKNFLVFCGNPGLGKTYLCAAMIPWALTKFNSFRCWHEDELLKRLRGGISEGNGDYLGALSLLIDDELVFFDDLGCNKPNEWREEIMFESINIRYNSMRPTVITTNLTRKNFYDRYHERVGSRIFATENLIIECHDAPDMRLQGK